jgi:predicted Zn-dependent peptidase
MEHITFKGTAAYPTTRAVSEAIEGVGGSFNAATDRESTVYWVRVPLRETTRGMDVLGELIVRPHLRGHEIESERTVIVEEIRSYLDDPGEQVHMLFDLAMFGDTPLGREIAGSEESVRALQEPDLRAGSAPAGGRACHVRPARHNPGPALPGCARIATR